MGSAEQQEDILLVVLAAILPPLSVLLLQWLIWDSIEPFAW